MSDVECKATVLQHQNWKRETNVAANVRQLAVHTSGAWNMNFMFIMNSRLSYWLNLKDNTCFIFIFNLKTQAKYTRLFLHGAKRPSALVYRRHWCDVIDEVPPKKCAFVSFMAFVSYLDYCVLTWLLCLILIFVYYRSYHSVRFAPWKHRIIIIKSNIKSFYICM